MTTEEDREDHDGESVLEVTPLIEAHRPADPALAKEYDDAARALRNLPTA